MIGAALNPDQFPAGGLKVGDKVRLIALADGFSNDDDDSFVVGQEIAVGEIGDVTVLGTNSTHFSIRVPESSANVVAQLVALDRLSLGLLDQSIDLEVVDPLAPAEIEAPLTIDEGASE